MCLHTWMNASMCVHNRMYLERLKSAFHGNIQKSTISKVETPHRLLQLSFCRSNRFNLLFNASLCSSGQEDQSSFSRVDSNWRRNHWMHIGSFKKIVNWWKLSSYYGGAEASTKQYQPCHQNIPKSKSGLNIARSKASSFSTLLANWPWKKDTGFLLAPAA